MAEASQYSADSGILTFMGVNISPGLADGDDAISVEQDSDTMTKTVGIRGDGVFSRSVDKSGTVKLKYLQNSTSGKFLSAKLNAIQAGVVVVGPLIFTEIGGDSKFLANKTTIKKQAPLKRGAKQNYVEYELITLDLTINHGVGVEV